MAKYTAIIADDEPLLRFHLQKMLTDICHDIEIVAHCENGQQALQAIDELNPDFLFLDIKMPELDGMAVAKKLASMKQAPLIAFITAYDEFAVKAFENNAVDYLLKPISENRLIKTCDKLKLQKKKTPTNDNSGAVLTDLLQQIQQLSSNAQPDYLAWVKAFKGEDLHLIAINDVLFFKAEDKYISIFAQSQGTLNEYIIRSSLKELQQKLDSEQFWQIHRSCIVNVSKIDKVKKDLLGHMKVHIQTHKLPVSRSGQSLFKGM